MAPRQTILPFAAQPAGQGERIVLGAANRTVADALADPSRWPYRTAVLAGPPRAGKSLFAGWFAAQPECAAIDGADGWDETRLFHRWNAVQQDGGYLLLITDRQPWEIALPDLRSRLGAALQLEISEPDDALAAGLIAHHAERRGLVLSEEARAYLLPRIHRTHAGIETLVAAIDRLSLERKVPAGVGLCRDALEGVQVMLQPRLL